MTRAIDHAQELRPLCPVPPPFGGSARLHPNGAPRAEFRRHLLRIDNRRNAVTVALLLILPVLLIATVVWVDHWIAVLLAIPLMGNFQLRWYLMNHEALHRVLFTNRRANEVFFHLFGWLALFTSSRDEHFLHHRDDTDENHMTAEELLGEAGGRQGLVFRYLLPVAAVRRIVMSSMFWGRLWPQVVIFGLFVLAGVPWLYLWLYVVPRLTVYRFFNAMRAASEHAGMIKSTDRRETTHHVTQPGPLGRFFLVPHNVGYHLAHHVDARVPFRNLPELDAALIEDGYVTGSVTWPSYRALLQAISAAKA